METTQFERVSMYLETVTSTIASVTAKIESGNYSPEMIEWLKGYRDAFQLMETMRG